MSDSSAVFPCRFAFTYTDQELKAYSRLVARRQDRGPNASGFFYAMIGVIVAPGLMVALARYLGFVAPSAYQPVLATAYIAFILGAAAYAFAVRLGYRRIARRYRAYAGEQSCKIAFDHDGVRCKDRRYDARSQWTSIADLRETDMLIVLWVGFRDGFVVPTRLFADASARAAFVAAVRKRIATAKSDRSEDGSPKS